MSTENTTPSIHTELNFKDLGVMPKLLELLTKNGITVPSPIQHQTIIPAIDGKDIVGIAQTGTGKTFAFGLPMLQRLASGKGRGLIVVPTRELAYQVEESLKPYASALGIRSVVCVGGSSMQLQRQAFKRNPRILVATPGRLNDHLERKTITLKEVEVLVLDEADRMFDMGFAPQINKILQYVPKERQTLFFSATMPKPIYELATREMKTPLRVEVAPAGSTADKVEQELIIVRQEDKKKLLLSLLDELKGSVLVFTRTKHGAKKVTTMINENRHKAAEIHGNRTLGQRRQALEGFKSGRYRILVATDIAARGIDVTNIGTVINMDLPDDAADYVHRIGRTGRAGLTGKAISFASPSQGKDVHLIETLIKTSLPRITKDAVQSLQLDSGKGSGGGGGGRRSGRGGGGGGGNRGRSNNNSSRGGFSSERRSNRPEGKSRSAGGRPRSKDRKQNRSA